MIKQLLENVPVPPSRVSAQEALRLGRRGVMRRSRVTVGAAAMATIVVAFAAVILTGQRGPAPGPGAGHSPQWTVRVLPNPLGSGWYQADAVDYTGRYVAGVANGQPVLWDNEKPTLLELHAENVMQVFVRGVTSEGTVVGDVLTRDGAQFGWIYRDGVASRLPRVGNDDRYSTIDMNRRGDVLGHSDRYGYLLWPAAQPGAVTQLGGDYGKFCLGEDGRVGGTIGDGDHPYIWDPAGKAQKMAELPGQPGGKVLFIRGEWAAGWARGGPPSGLIGARWNLRTGELTTYPELKGVVLALSASGALVASRVGLGEPVLATPDGHLLELPNPMPNAHYPAHVAAMSSSGTLIVGSARDVTHPSVAVVWRFE